MIKLNIFGLNKDTNIATDIEPLTEIKARKLREQFMNHYQEELILRAEDGYLVDTKWYNKAESRNSKNAYDLYRKIQSEAYTNGIECWQFFDPQGVWHILSKRDFLDQFAPFEKEVPEYRYYIEDSDGYIITEEFYTDEEWKLQHLQKDSKIQRLDATKRIRYARC